jgi:hypothetical protein
MNSARKKSLKQREVVIPPSQKESEKFVRENATILFNINVTGFGDANGNKSLSCEINGDTTQMIEGLTRVCMSNEKLGDVIKVVAAMFLLSTTHDEDVASHWLNGKA